ncbi:MAG: 1-acyl-sn-glycerol-3-phosphate acyltransferase [Verrucomicrobia bacterium]|nr:1-acyl-sn-glycerol-3-phosphate acyltransferase [Verrucomicrobiota bacterium]
MLIGPAPDSMRRVVIDKPYVPVPPRHGRLWPRLLSCCVPRLLRQHYGVTEVGCAGVEHLKASLRAGHGIILAPNHSRDEDPLVLGMLARAAGSPFFIMASWHLFTQRPTLAFLLPRAGAFSVYREGIDRAALHTAIDILEHAERPLVIFPEGHISRTNDRLNHLMEGIAVIARSAARKRARLEPPAKIVVHPVAIRYRFHGDVPAAVAAVLDQIESRLTWTPHRHLAPLERIRKVGEALLTLKELEHLGHPNPGLVADRLPRLMHAILAPLEDEWTGGNHDGTAYERVKRLRAAILPDLVKGDLSESERDRRWRDLANANLALQLAHYPPGYLSENSPAQRFLETLERFEEDLTDRVGKHGPISANVTVGDAIEVSPARDSHADPDPLLPEIKRQLEDLMGIQSPEVQE